MLSRAANSKPATMRRVGETAIRIAPDHFEVNIARIELGDQLHQPPNRRTMIRLRSYLRSRFGPVVSKRIMQKANFDRVNKACRIQHRTVAVARVDCCDYPKIRSNN
jgi:hypothetical protein